MDVEHVIVVPSHAAVMWKFWMNGEHGREELFKTYEEKPELLWSICSIDTYEQVVALADEVYGKRM